MSFEIYVLAFGIIMLSGMIQGITSFGFSLLAVPLLSLLMPLQLIVPILVIFSLVMNVIIFTKVKGHINKLQIALLVIFGLSSIPIGINALQGIDENIIKIVVGVVIIISAISMNFGLKVKFKNQNIAYAITGFFSGILNGSSSLSGPPVILLLSNEGASKENFRKTLSTYFLVLNLFTIPIFIMEKMITEEVLVNTLKLSPALFIGVFTGVFFGNRLPDRIFKKVTLVLIFVMGVLTITSAL